MKKRILPVLLSLALLLCLVPVNASAVSVINSISLSIDSPVAGQYPPGTATPQGNGYSIYAVDWMDETDDRYLESGDKIQSGHEYYAYIWVMAESGYEFRYTNSYTPNVSATVNGTACTVEKAYEYSAWAMVCVRYDFPVVGSEKPHTHTPGEWTCNAADHYRVCTECYEMIENNPHTGGTLTCTSKPICTVCGFAYGYEEPDHKWSPTYLYRDATGHAWICADCKAVSVTEPHIPGPAATETSPQTCTECGYILTPVKNHTHKLTQVAAKDATCLEDGNTAYYTCSGCSDWFKDAAGKQKITDKASVTLEALGHFSDTWGYNDTQHWGICHVCNAVMEDTRVAHEALNVEGCCETCGYVLGMDITEPTEETTESTQATKTVETTEATETTEVSEPTEITQIAPETGAKAKRSDSGIAPWVLYLLVGLGCLFLSAGVTLFIIKKKK